MTAKSFSKTTGWQAYLYLIVAGLSLAGCTVATPFKGTIARLDVPEDQPVYVGLTEVVLGDDRAKNKVFWRQIDSVYDSLDGQAGLLGYSVRRELFGNTGWTMTVWEDAAAMRSFVQGPAHRAARAAASDAVFVSTFYSAEFKAGEVPLAWDDAINLLNTEGRSY